MPQAEPESHSVPSAIDSRLEPSDLPPGLPRITWDQDYRQRMNPGLLMQLLRESVPALDHLGWRLTEVREGYAASVLPLNEASTNQHGTHQAVLVALAGDYTGGAAIGGLIRGVPFIGVHPQDDGNGAALWLAGFEMRYLAPSAGELTVEASISPQKWAAIRRRYVEGRAVLETIELRFVSDGELVATGKFSYFLRQASAMQPATPYARPNPLSAHKSKASARLIAGCRAMEARAPDPLVIDGYAEAAAGPHGLLLAERLVGVLPQLRQMVAARTRDVDDLIRRHHAEGLEQLVLIGAGLDARPFRLLSRDGDPKVFELDLPHMLEERRRVFANVADMPGPHRVQVPIDLRLQDLQEVLRAAPGFDAGRHTVFVYEGVSMYQSGEHNLRTLAAVRGLMAHPRSTLWVDTVARAAVERRTGSASADAFVEGMRKLGEPFIFGLDDAAPFFAEAGLAVHRHVPSSAYDRGGGDPLFDSYGFWHLGAGEY